MAAPEEKQTADSSGALWNDNKKTRTPVRGTQSFVRTLSSVWRRPSLTLREIAWRWGFGIPAAYLLLTQGSKVWAAATGGTMDARSLGLDPALLADPVGALTANTMGAAGKFGLAFTTLLAQARPVAVWLMPLLFVGWVIVSALGRAWVTHAVDPTLKVKPLTLITLQVLRTGTLLLLLAVWIAGLHWSAQTFVAAPLAQGQEANLVGYSAGVILISLGLFVAWAAVSWVLSVAPLLAMLGNLGVGGSLKAALNLGPLKGKLVEVNLVMGIVKIALIILAMVFSATPLPFQTVTTASFLEWWCAGVMLLYVLWSDFFHVVRLMSYMHLWRAFAPGLSAGDTPKE